MEEISVGYRYVTGGAYHTMIFYEDNKGNKYFIEAGPENRHVSAVDKVGFTLSDPYASSALGRLVVDKVTKIGPTSEDENGDRYADYPRQAIAIEPNLRAQWNQIQKLGIAINEGNYAYLPLKQNSNTFAFAALKYAGLPAPTGYAIKPGEVEVGEYFIQGAGLPIAYHYNPPECFVAGTPILMADGTEKPIEEVRIGDNVMSFDPKADRGLGANVPKRVTRLFRNETNELVDLRGLKMTPGHVVLSDNGEWLTISQVLKQDRCIVEDRGGKPVLVRARTGIVAGTEDDTPIFVAYVDPNTNRETAIKVRAGIPSLYSGTNDVWYSVARVVAIEGGKVRPSGDIVFGNEISECIDWPENSTPFDHKFQRDFIVADANGQAYMPEWVAAISEASEERGQVVNGSSRNMRVISSSYPPMSGGLNRRERRKQTALRRVK